jgi:hydroxymethylbilane synthase
MIIGTRGSELALVQALEVLRLLRAAHPNVDFEERVVKTAGDLHAQRSIAEFSATGIFVKEIDELVLRGEIDLAVHSLKDVPTTLPDGLAVAAVLPRMGGRDFLVARDGLEGLPLGARIGTSSLRRQAQLRRFRQDLQPLDIRGNVPTRLRKWREGQVDALVLSEAGLRRLGLVVEGEVLDPQLFVPSPGQGVVAITTKADGKPRGLASALDHPGTRLAVEVEREVLRGLGGGCLVPIAARAELKGENLHIQAEVISPDGLRSVGLRRSIRASHHLEGARQLARDILSMGGGEILGV